MLLIISPQSFNCFCFPQNLLYPRFSALDKDTIHRARVKGQIWPFVKLAEGFRDFATKMCLGRYDIAVLYY